MPAPGALDTRAKVLLILFLCLLVGLSAHRLLFAPPIGPYVAFSGATMGTTFDVKVASADLGRTIPGGEGREDGFEVLGRARIAEERGCSIAADSLLSGSTR